MELKLDAKDLKIIKELDANARSSNAKIGRKVRLSKDSVNYRIKNLENKKIISGYYTTINISKLGFETYKMMLAFHNTTSEIENKILNYLKKSKHVGWLVSCDGNYQLMAVLWVKNRIIFNDFLNNFLKNFSSYLKERDVIIITENHSKRKNYLYQGKNEFPDIYYKDDQEVKIRKGDLDLIKQIANNARIPLYKIANKLGLTAEAVTYKKKQLEKKGIIQAFRPTINTKKLGYEYYNILFRLKKFDKIDEIFNFFKDLPHIIYFVKYLGNYDLGIDLEVKNSEELRKIIEEIKNKFSKDIESYTAILIYQEHKLSYFPEL